MSQEREPVGGVIMWVFVGAVIGLVLSLAIVGTVGDELANAFGLRGLAGGFFLLYGVVPALTIVGAIIGGVTRAKRRSRSRTDDSA